jgi:hypothetical protein
MSSFKGIFEIHVTVDPCGNYLPLIDFCNKYECKPVYAVASKGIFNNQYMISKWTSTCNGTEAITKAEFLADKMRQEYGIDVKRVKVEAMANAQGVPANAEDYANVCNFLLKENGTRPYFEYHFKVVAKKDLSYNDLERDCNNLGAAVSINMMGKLKNPLVTMRMYDMGRKESLEKMAEFKEKIVALGHEVQEGTQHEFAIYDDNVNVDDGWMIE